VALRLRGLPGFLFLDTADAEARGTGDALSIVGALPHDTVTGTLPEDLEALQDALGRIGGDAAADWGLPAGGLFGTVDFRGEFRFGAYRELLIHRHGSGEWFAVGDALPAALEQSDDAFAGPPRFPEVPPVQFSPGMGRERFCSLVRKVKDYIAAGDIYQVNLSQRFNAPWPADSDPFGLYLRLRECSPAPFAAFFDQGDRQVISSSPELFLSMSGAGVTTRPIKGTRPRHRDPGDDERSATELITSPKERAELVMITDLERNDLGQVCEFGSVRVEDLLKLERFPQVFHLVSTVVGRLRREIDHAAALSACFPGGSISGAPKKRALEIIEELEPEPRGLYTGTVGYLGAGGESQFNIAIRTAVVEAGTLSLHTGAGIVADSDPDAEYEETLHKAAGVFAAVGA
jgi:aminodeoxychorismate synthase component I